MPRFINVSVHIDVIQYSISLTLITLIYVVTITKYLYVRVTSRIRL